MSDSFESKKVIIAGGSSGIGLATAAILVKEKANVTVTGRAAAKLAAAAKENPGIQTAALDSNNRKELDEFFHSQGNFDHLVIALSGAKGAGNFADLSLQDLRDGFEGKFWPQLNTLQAALPYVNKGGSITLITAISAISKAPGVSGLAAINGALELMIPSIAKEIQPLRINAVSPGVVNTAWWDFLPADAKAATFQQYASQLPVGRVGEPEEVADTILFLMRNGNITGTVIRCDGGLSL
ncbi:NAD(P)-dependent dehydrogenase, short-chain alcohol dehydrogenase family [Chitinophaga ginsengisegetis]|uniref:NAD(P)-dependent dehydrogenase, short-chain alcohol dehydrogenase family n=1 Tax=Chitinophaga ginsengisegetis TaxID=393003 RepID=A0A1T5NAG4_9BACT|nr:SDR family oxidoreductase [Chitinophaga ginsengisegetis]SKC97426.1 NAD(P)-dependent dehydrogenase, short-chain alcohol dehydrogenase family [Chitinophaga ginsengisegetis]